MRESDHGASYRQLIDLAALDSSLFVSTVGQGEQPLSPFFDFYVARWLEGSYLPMRRDHLHSVLLLEPATMTIASES